VFVDTTAVVNRGWIQPLIAKLLDDANLVAVPHYDDWATSDRLVCIDFFILLCYTYKLQLQLR